MTELYILILITILFIYSLIYIGSRIIYNIFTKYSITKTDTYIICIQSLELMITNCRLQYIYHISDLKKKYDINKTSPVNSISTYNKELDKISSQLANDIITKYLSKDLLNLLLHYFTMDSLILYIINKLREGV